MLFKIPKEAPQAYTPQLRLMPEYIPFGLRLGNGESHEPYIQTPILTSGIPGVKNLYSIQPGDLESSGSQLVSKLETPQMAKLRWRIPIPIPITTPRE